MSEKIRFTSFDQIQGGVSFSKETPIFAIYKRDPKTGKILDLYYARGGTYSRMCQELLVEKRKETRLTKGPILDYLPEPGRLINYR